MFPIISVILCFVSQSIVIARTLQPACDLPLIQRQTELQLNNVRALEHRSPLEWFGPSLIDGNKLIVVLTVGHEVLNEALADWRRLVQEKLLPTRTCLV